MQESRDTNIGNGNFVMPLGELITSTM